MISSSPALLNFRENFEKNKSSLLNINLNSMNSVKDLNNVNNSNLTPEKNINVTNITNSNYNMPRPVSNLNSNFSSISGKAMEGKEWLERLNEDVEKLNKQSNLLK